MNGERRRLQLIYVILLAVHCYLASYPGVSYVTFLETLRRHQQRSACLFIRCMWISWLPDIYSTIALTKTTTEKQLHLFEGEFS